jgi:hypothetical protein
MQFNISYITFVIHLVCFSENSVYLRHHDVGVKVVELNQCKQIFRMIMLEFGNKTGTDFYTDVMVSQINTILTETNEMYYKCYVAYIELHAFFDYSESKGNNM